MLRLRGEALLTTDMINELLITGASQVLTLRGPARARVGAEMRDLAIVEDGALLVRGDSIAAVGAAMEVEPLAGSEAERIDARGMMVLPGFVDAHTHPVFAGSREDEYEMRAAGLTYQDIAARGGGIRSTVRKTRASTEDQLFDSALPRINRMLAHGTN